MTGSPSSMDRLTIILPSTLQFLQSEYTWTDRVDRLRAATEYETT